MPHDPRPSDLPALSRALIESHWSHEDDVLVPSGADLDLPEMAVQFGTGAFLRGFVDFFLDEARHAGCFPGRIVAIGSTGSGRDASLNAQNGLFTLVTRGLVHGAPYQERRIIGSVSRALSSQTEWDEALRCARNPHLELIFSNTTEVGITLDPNDAPNLAPPRSFPGKLTAFLYERAKTFDFAETYAPVVLPCELVESNGDRLREIVLELATRWQLEPAFAEWIRAAVPFCNTLVDRIVTGTPPDARLLAANLGYQDAMITECEPYRLFVIEGDDALRTRLRFASADAGAIVTTDVGPYRERKVRLLNGGHTITTPLALLSGLGTVAEAVNHPAVGQFLRRVMMDEIASGLQADGAREFAAAVLERFANPFVRHSLIDITLHSTMKMRVRVVPSILRYVEQTNQAPPLLALGFAAWFLWMRGDVQTKRRADGLPVPRDDQADKLREHWSNASNPTALVEAVCGDAPLWGTDLNGLTGFTDAVTQSLRQIMDDGIDAALATRLDAAIVPH